MRTTIDHEKSSIIEMLVFASDSDAVEGSA